MSKYKRISKDDVYRKMVSTAIDPFNPIMGAINLKNLAYLLETSRYQVKKYMEELKQEGMVELKCFDMNLEDELFPPYWGYLLTDKGRDTDYYKQESDKECKRIEECFAV